MPHKHDKARTSRNLAELLPQSNSEGIFSGSKIFTHYAPLPVEPIQNHAHSQGVEDKKPSPLREPPTQRHLRHKRRFTAQKNWLQKKAQAVFALLNHYASCMGFLGAIRAAILDILPDVLLRATIFISPIARIIGGLKMLKNTLLQPLGKWTRALILACSLCLIGFGVAAILYPLLGFTFTAASTCCNVALSLWYVSCALKNKFWGSGDTGWKETRTQLKLLQEGLYRSLAEEKTLESYLEYRARKYLDPKDFPSDIYFQIEDLEHRILELKNQHQQLQADLAMKVHNLALTLLALTGIILALFPPTMIAGVAIILATNIHGLAFGSNLNGKWPKALKKILFPEVHLESAQELNIKVRGYEGQAQLQPSSTAMATQALSRLPSPSPNPSLISPEKKCQPTSGFTPAFWDRFGHRQAMVDNTAPSLAAVELVPVVHV